MISQEWLRQKAENVDVNSYFRSVLPELIESRKLSLCHVKFGLITKGQHRYSIEELHKLAAPLVACMVTAIVLHLLAGLSREHSNFVLVAIRGVVSLALLTFVGAITTDAPVKKTLQDNIQTLLSDWPSDIRTAIKKFDLEPSLLEYVCCKRCFTLYDPHNYPYGGDFSCPRNCTFRETPTSDECATQLLDANSDGRTKPSCHFFYQPLSSWIGWLLSRPGLPNILRTSLSPEVGQMHDLWDGDVFRSFKGPDGKPYLEVEPNQSNYRLIFSLFINWFSPWGTKKNGSHASVRVIYMVCCNLPPHLRYRIENVYIAGIIPGPTEPSLHHLNHILRPLVNDLLRGWECGFHFTQTAIHEFGCMVRCAIIPLVCDLPALRKALGAIGHRAIRFCSFCLLTRSHIAEFDVNSWGRRSWQEHLRIATEWRDATTESLRNTIYQKHGIRWSELLRLPYWDPTIFQVVEAMHNLFLGELQHHCRQILRMNADADEEHGGVPLHSPEEQQRYLDAGIAAIRKGSRTELGRIRKGYVVSLAHANNVNPLGNRDIDLDPLRHDGDQLLTKSVYVEALLQWVSVIYFVIQPYC